VFLDDKWHDPKGEILCLKGEERMVYTAKFEKGKQVGLGKGH